MWQMETCGASAMLSDSMLRCRQVAKRHMASGDLLCTHGVTQLGLLHPAMDVSRIDTWQAKTLCSMPLDLTLHQGELHGDTWQ
jgi:hypothetical protein